MNEDLLALIKYRLQQADDSMKEAKVLLKEGMSLRSVMNRLYYALCHVLCCAGTFTGKTVMYIKTLRSNIFV